MIKERSAMKGEMNRRVVYGDEDFRPYFFIEECINFVFSQGLFDLQRQPPQYFYRIRFSLFHKISFPQKEYAASYKRIFFTD